MKTIYKYELELITASRISMPTGAVILSAQIQRGAVCLWAMVDTRNTAVPREFTLIQTGQVIPEVSGKINFISTLQLHDGYLVLHLFEIMP